MPDDIDPLRLPPPTDLLEWRHAAEQATQAQRMLNAEFDISRQLGRQFGQAMTSAFLGLAVQGKGFGEVLKSLALSLSKLALNAAFKPLSTAFGGALQGLLSGSVAGNSGAAPALGLPMLFAGGGALLQGLMSGGLAGKGSASLAAGTPQLFAGGGVIAAPQAFPLGNTVALSQMSSAAAPPDTGAAPPANAAAGGMDRINVSFHITTPDAESFRRSESQIAAMLARTVGSGRRNL